MFNISLQKYKTLNRAKILGFFGSLWKQAFPLVVGVLFVASILFIGTTGYNALYKSDLSADERSIQAQVLQLQNQFKQARFDALLADIDNRQAKSTQKLQTVPDIFYDSSIPRKQK